MYLLGHIESDSTFMDLSKGFVDKNMNDSYLRLLQEMEYMESLRQDIEKDIILEERTLDFQEVRRVELEKKIIEDANVLDYEMERCRLSPRSLRLKRLNFFEPEKNKVKNVQSICLGITKKGTRCKKTTFGEYCFIHCKQ
jgi:hypothetical protein